MGDFIGFCCFAIIGGLFIYNAQGCANDQLREEIIKNNGFCVHAFSTGQSFEKCYELKEKLEIPK